MLHAAGSSENGSFVRCMMSLSIYESVEEGASECLHMHLRPEIPHQYLAVLE